MTDYAERRFFEDTKEHRLDVRHDDGIYRHLHFAKPGTVIYHFDIVTWPGHLAITGDGGDFLFARTKDMVEFFMYRQGQRLTINRHYWSEKLVAPRPDGALEFSQRLYKQLIEEWLKDKFTEMGEGSAYSELSERVAHELLYDSPLGESEAFERLRLFGRIDDYWEWALLDYRFDFLWCCWAIVWGLRKYTERAGA